MRWIIERKHDRLVRVETTLYGLDYNVAFSLTGMPINRTHTGFRCKFTDFLLL